MKKFVSLSLIVLCLLCVTACSSDTQETPTSSEDVGVVVESATFTSSAEESSATDEGFSSVESTTIPEDSSSTAESTPEPEEPSSTVESIAEAEETPEIVEDLYTGVSVQEMDVDLTTLSSTMVFGEVYNMLVHPEEYIGNTIKMAGVLEAYKDVYSDEIFYAVVISDATACCAQGIEFLFKEGEVCPEEGTFITIIGEFESFEVSGRTYPRLKEAYIV